MRMVTPTIKKFMRDSITAEGKLIVTLRYISCIRQVHHNMKNLLTQKIIFCRKFLDVFRLGFLLAAYFRQKHTTCYQPGLEAFGPKFNTIKASINPDYKTFLANRVVLNSFHFEYCLHALVYPIQHDFTIPLIQLILAVIQFDPSNGPGSENARRENDGRRIKNKGGKMRDRKMTDSA
jgi:hypothetical protein